MNAEHRNMRSQMYRRREIDESILYALMFVEIMRAININGLNSNNVTNPKFNIETTVVKNDEPSHNHCECSICYEEREQNHFIKLNCGHEFCKDCIKQSLQNERREIPCCAFCRADIKHMELKQDSILDEFTDLLIS